MVSNYYKCISYISSIDINFSFVVEYGFPFVCHVLYQLTVKMNQSRRVIGISCKLHVQRVFSTCKGFSKVQSGAPNTQLVTRYISILNYDIFCKENIYM
jgi:hypothetical protein